MNDKKFTSLQHINEKTAKEKLYINLEIKSLLNMPFNKYSKGAI